jgi:uncharacterized protein YndB with AHSA1/START domain
VTTHTVNRTDTEFSITRTLAAPIETVWEVWTKPEHFARWFHAVPGSVHLDVRPGGEWAALLDTPHGEMALGGAYREVVRHRKLAWTMPTPDGEVVMAAAFTDHGATTELRYSQNVVPSDDCADPAEGSMGILDSLAQYLDELG